MVAQSKLAERSLTDILTRLTSLYLQHRKRISRTVYVSLFLALVHRTYNAVSEQKDASHHQEEVRKHQTKNPTAPSTTPTAKKRVEVNREFFRNLLRLVRIAIPGWRSKEMRLLFSHSFFLGIRTLLSLYIAELDGKLVSSLVRGRGREFLRGLVWWMIVAVPSTFTNSMLSYHQAKLSLQYRTRLTAHVQSKYLANMTFYSLSALDDRIKNPDHLIAVDVARFSNSLAELYSNLAKPVLDILVYNYSLSRSVGGEALFMMSFLVQVSANVMRALTPPFGKYVAEEARLEGEFRFRHSRLIDYSEEIAFYRGHETEKDTLDKGYFTLIKHVNRILRRRLYHGVMEDFVVKYFWGGLGLLLCSVPVFFQIPGQQEGLKKGTNTTGDRTESFVTNRRMLLSSSDAVGRVMFSYKEIAELAGHTSRVTSLLDVMADIQEGKFSKTPSANADPRSASVAAAAAAATSKLLNPSSASSSPEPPSPTAPSSSSKTHPRNDTLPQNAISFNAVPLLSPSGTILLPSLTFTIQPHQNLLILGPNGCGKSSLFRLLGGLWPLPPVPPAVLPSSSTASKSTDDDDALKDGGTTPLRGTITKPSNPRDIFYVPQKPYLLSSGSLREQIIYPDNVREMHSRGVTDADLEDILRDVGLESLLAGSFASSSSSSSSAYHTASTITTTGTTPPLDFSPPSWPTLLPPGQTQLLALSRLLYHRPLYAILDECTSSLPLALESKIYTRAQELGITLMTVSHRRTLWRFHGWVLRFDGVGGCWFGEMRDPGKWVELEAEREEVRGRLRGVEEGRRRLRELEEAGEGGEGKGDDGMGGGLVMQERKREGKADVAI